MAAAAKDDPAQQWGVFPPCKGVLAVAAVRARAHDAFAFGPSAQTYVQKTAESQSQEAGKDGNKRANHAWVEYTS